MTVLIEQESVAILSDRLIALRVAQALADLHIPILRTLAIEVRSDVVTLRGRVRNYYERQLAHAHSKRVPGVRKVVDDVTVASAPSGFGDLSTANWRSFSGATERLTA